MIRRLLLVLAALVLAPCAQAQDLARETAQVEDLRSVREIKRLQALWGHYALAGDWQAMAALAAEDVRVELPSGAAVGRAALEQSLRAGQGKGADGMPAGRLNLRLYMSPVVTLAPDGKAAVGRWRLIALTGEKGAAADWIGRTEVVAYRKTPEGWRIAQIHPYPHFAGPYHGGWRHDAATLSQAGFHYTPDMAGQVLPERAAATPRTREEIDREATLLLEQSRAQNVFNAFGYYLDRGLYDDIAELFAPDAVIEVAGQGTWRGPDAVRRYLGRFGAPGLDEGELNDRPLLMPLASISADGSSALIRAVELGMTGQHGGDGFWSAGIQSALLRRGEDGKWRIALLHFSPLMRAGYARGWADPLPAALPIGESLWPDGPSELPDVSYPGNAMTLKPFGAELVMPARGDAQIVPVADALKLAEAFDGAENVSNAYGYYVDQFLWRHVAALFAADGWKELSYVGTVVGRERVLESLVARYGGGEPDPAFQTFHQTAQPYVTVLDDGEHAHIRTRLLQFNSASTGPGGWISGIYENQVVKDEGVWRIHGMDLEYSWLADYATGWTGADPAASRRFAPTAEELARFDFDAPLRGETFAPFPRVAPMGFHYVNPVSGREPALKLEWSAGYPPELEPE